MILRRTHPIHAVIVALTFCAVDSRFTTSSAHAAAPVLVLTDGTAANPFGAYLSEILRGEGLLAFDQRDRAALSSSPDPAALLSSYSAVAMAEMSLAPAEQQLLRNYVHAGGILIGARPDAGLSDVFGVEFAGNRPERLLQYFGVDANLNPGRGLTHGALQYHGVAANYNLQGATGLAYLYANATTPTANPAVTAHSYGAGQAIAFAFDPAKSVVLTRQGNPAWQNTEGDGIPQYRPHDMFARTDGRTYYDPSRIAIPHADELQRFLANVLIDANEAPLPRMWYLPGIHKSLMVNTGDGEDNFGAQFDAILNDAASYGGKFSVYLRDIGVTNTTVAKEAQWRAAGHEVGVHVFAGGAEGAGAIPALTNAYNNIVTNLENKFGHTARTARSHTIDWTGWVDMARIEANRGTQLDANYYHYLNGSVVNPLTTNGYFTGSGLAQRFIDEEGDLLEIYQAATQWPDEWFADNGMTAQQAFNIMQTMFEAAESEGYYSTFVNNVHPVRYYNGADVTSTWARAIWQYCQEQGIPMWSAEMLLDFTLARNESQFTGVAHSPGLLEFDYVAGSGGFDLTLMIPVDWAERRLREILVDGAPTDWIVEEIKGIEYAMLTTQADGAHVAASYALPSPADFNGDGYVDGNDLAKWQGDFGANAFSDADGDGDSDGADFLAWQRQLAGSPLSAVATTLPESPALQSTVIGALLLFGRPLRRAVLDAYGDIPARQQHN